MSMLSRKDFKNGKLNLKPRTLREPIRKFKKLKFESPSAKLHPGLWLRVDQWDRAVPCLGMVYLHGIGLKKRTLGVH